ncbi:MAG TPA: ribosome silencing factor [Deltaproteobacteria bacterium]|nr:ribosome silencing factor [Deltaproteobacteria bacterium]
MTIEPEAVAEALAAAALSLNATDVVILDMRELVDYTDLFVLCTARNRRHVQAMADEIRQIGKRELDLPCAGIEGLPAARWVLVDFESVVVHIFDAPLRAFYNLDGLWADAPRLEIPQVEGSAEDKDERFPEPFGA